MFNKVYPLLHRSFSNPKERDEYSSGHWQEVVRKRALSLCKGSSGRLLEVGCGEGLFLGQLSSSSPDLEIWGIDLDGERLHRAKERAGKNNHKNIKLSLQDATRLSFGNEYFDTVVCINTFLNMRSIELVKQSLIQMRRVCKSNGRIIFDFRNALNPLLKLKYGLAKYYDNTIKNLPLNTYPPAQIESVLKDLGLKVNKRISVGWLILKSLAPIILIEAGKDVL